MAKTKTQMAMAIIDIVFSSHTYPGGDVSTSGYHSIVNKMQLKLQKIPNKRLASILGNLEEALICRYRKPGKGYCQNPSQNKKVYCTRHVVGGEGRQ